MASHSKGYYPITNGSDKERGGVRPGPRRKPISQKVKDFLIEFAARQARKAAMRKLTKELRKRQSPRSHHHLYYKIINGSDHDKGGIRRGPRRGKRKTT